MQDAIRKVIESVENFHGQTFFERICTQLSKVIDADFVFIARFDMERFVSKTVVVVTKQGIADNFEYSLVGTPCADILSEPICSYCMDVTKQFPDDQLLRDMGIEGYMGAALSNSKGEIFGLVTALYQSPIANPELSETLLQVFSGRIASELERFEYEVSLENTVEERTKQLSQAVADMEKMQTQLIESEKMAALGNLVAGVAHEVNTPLGIAITAHSHLAAETNEFKHRFQNGGVKRSELLNYLETTSESLKLLDSNLHRAAHLMSNFKKISADQHAFSLENINVGSYYKAIVDSISPMVHDVGGTVDLTVPRGLQSRTFPGAHVQVLTNLCQNSIRHGYDPADIDDLQISITLEPSDEGILVVYKDNGKGVDEKAKDRIFEPFFTTDRQSGGTGLGMSICYNLMKRILKGWITFVDTHNDRGAEFHYWFPLQIGPKSS